MQLGQLSHVPQYVAVELAFMQIWTPGLPERSQSLTSCSMQGQLVLEVFRRQTHSRGGPCRQAMPADSAQAGMLLEHSMVPVHAIPPQCSAPLAGGVDPPHCVSDRSSVARSNKAINGCLRWRRAAGDIGSMVVELNSSLDRARNETREPKIFGSARRSLETMSVAGHPASCNHRPGRCVRHWELC